MDTIMSVITFSKPRIVNNPKWIDKPSKTQAINRRVELLGKMDDRHRELLARRDKQGLVDLAGEYMTLGHGCPNTMTQILIESEGL
jgi:hypothetical protein